MNRAIHAAVRRDLGRFLDALSRFGDGDARRAEQLATAWANFDFQLTIHHEGEREIAWPALAKVGVTHEVIAAMDAEHDVMAARLADARAAMATLRSAPTSANAQAAHAAMTELQAVTVQHLDHEEAELEPVYLANVNDPAIKEMGRKFGKVGPKQGGTFFAWVSDGADPEAMRGIEGSVPAPIRVIIGGLFGRGYRRDVASVWSS